MGKKKGAAPRDEIKKDLSGQLERNGTVGKYYADLIEDYMCLWDTKNLLNADIKGRGVIVETETRFGISTKKNDSIGDLVKVNAQMLKLLSELGIKPSPVDSDGDEL